MITKVLEIRDRNTFIPVLAVQLMAEHEQERYLLARAGYGRTAEAQRKYILLCRIAGGSGKCSSDVYEWGDRTMQVCHDYIEKNWDSLEPGAVIDVQYLLGETKEPKVSERVLFGDAF